MGLDITAYSHLTPIGRHTGDEWCDDEDHVQAFAYDDFPQSFRGLPILAMNEAASATFIEGGCYAETDQTETIRFRAGSYHGYNVWRDDLKRQFNPDTQPDGPFYELIWFADNEGSIGPDAARDLLTDFQQHADKYQPSGSFSDYFREKYRDWTRACELAADGGLISFH